MIVKAVKSFVGSISMNIDDVREIIDKELAEDLIRAGHCIEVKAAKVETKPIKEVEKEVEEKTTKKNKNKK